MKDFCDYDSAKESENLVLNNNEESISVSSSVTKEVTENGSQDNFVIWNKIMTTRKMALLMKKLRLLFLCYSRND